MSSLYILSGSRTPIGSLLGSLSQVPAVNLGATAIKGALERKSIKFSDVQEVFMGMVIQAGAGQAPARQSSILAGIPDSIPCSTINKVCGSGMQAVIAGARSILAGDNDLVVAGGMENMSLAPFLIPNMRTGHKFGPTQILDSMQWDGLWDVYGNQAMGNCAEECVTKYEFSREELDQFAIESFKKAQKACTEGIFKKEITPVIIKGRKGDQVIDQDEGPFKANFEKIPQLSPAFTKDGKLTAANSSTINDGAAAIVLGSDKYKDKADFKIVGWARHAQHPTWFTTAPIEAIQKCLNKCGLKKEDIELWEINEAFSVVAMSAIKELKLNEQDVNVFGSGISLGHPIGATGARMLVTLMNAMKVKNAKRGLASMCIGGGEALAMIIERI